MTLAKDEVAPTFKYTRAPWLSENAHEHVQMELEVLDAPRRVQVALLRNRVIVMIDGADP